MVAEVWPLGGRYKPTRRPSLGGSLKEKITSFSTGPKSTPTHWKQTAFLLREPIMVQEGKLLLDPHALADSSNLQERWCRAPSTATKTPTTRESLLWRSTTQSRLTKIR